MHLKRIAALLLLILPAAGLMAQTLGQALDSEAGLYVQVSGELRVNVRIVDHNMVLYALDADGKLVPPPFAKAVVQVEDKRGSDDEHLVLRAHDGDPWLSHPRFLKPPYFFELRILLYPQDGSDEGRISVPALVLKQLP